MGEAFVFCFQATSDSSYIKNMLLLPSVTLYIVFDIRLTEDTKSHKKKSDMLLLLTEREALEGTQIKKFE